MSTENKGGPKTEAGKAISRMNAVTHGLLSQETLLPDEPSDLLGNLSEAIRKELQPQGELESFLVDRITTDMWRLRRAIAIETANIARTRAVILDDVFVGLASGGKDGQKLAAKAAGVANDEADKITRYSTSIERSMYRALHELQRLQAARNGQNVLPPAIIDVNTDSAEK